ncbi:MAG: hypothetical protein M3245_06210 [Actinomycetota bacterium]|nr:hypothetical protein [Actinomycetota bacterium]
MDPVGVLVIIAIVGGAVALVVWAQKASHRRLTARAQELGLAYVPDMPADEVNALQLPLMARAASRGRRRGRISAPVTGTWQGMDVRLFTYAWDIQTRRKDGTTSTRTERYRCAVTSLPSEVPAITIESGGAFMGLVDRIEEAVTGGGGLRHVRFDTPEDFEEKVAVESAVETRAREVLTDDARAWLMGQVREIEFQIGGVTVMALTSRTDVKDERLLEALKGLRERLLPALGGG